jgi:uncharacterized membrane protein
MSSDSRGSVSPDTFHWVVLLALAAVFLLIGVALTRGIAPNHLIGVRTVLTFSSNEAWQRINGGAGIVIALIAYGVFYGAAARPRSTLPWFAILIGGIVAAAALCATLPDVVASIYTASVRPLPIDEAQTPRTLVPFAFQLLVGAVGFLLWTERIPPNRFIGIRIRGIQRSPADWYAANRIAGAWLQAGSAISVAILFAGVVRGWHTRTIVWSSLALLVLTVFAAWMAARSTLAR